LQAHVIFDRYVPSNIAHQCSKLAKQTPDNWLGLAKQIEAVEYGLLRLPRPDMVFYLDLTAKQSYVRTHARDTEKDIHQDDIDYLWWVREVYMDYASTDRGWHVIQCFDGDRERTVDEIHQEIYTIFEAQQ
jgi:dTMP kinase